MNIAEYSETKYLKINVNAKINFVLDVLSKRVDGYHNLEMIMQSISIFDTVVLSECSSGINLTSNSSEIPSGSDNIAFKAALLIKNEMQISKGIKIHIEKRIPIAAGLGGGSADAAAVLFGLNEFWELGIDNYRMTEYAMSLGADVPFFLLGGTALARGIGEKLTRLKDVEGLYLVLVKPDFGVSTSETFGKLVLTDYKCENLELEKIINLSISSNSLNITNFMFNKLEDIVINLHPEIADIKDKLIFHGAKSSMMSGSGPTVYGVFGDRFKALECFELMKKNYKNTFMVNTVNNSLEIIEEQLR